MLHISLFSGIGGFDLAAEWMGWKNIVSCEINDFGNKVLEHYWPDAYHHRDVKTLTLEKINEQLGDGWRTDDVILTGGFPCQPYSSAGKRKGKEDERHLWPEMLRVIREVAPRWIVGENVLGLVNWSGGLVFEEVQADLEAQGYEVQPYVLPAAAVNAPHRRDRVWFVAYSNGNTKRSPRESGSIEGSWSNNNDVTDKWGSKTEFNIGSPKFSQVASNTHSNEQHERNGLDEINTSKGRQYAQRDTDKGHEHGDATDTDSRGLERPVEIGWNGKYVIGENGIASQTRNATDTENQRLEGVRREERGYSQFFRGQFRIPNWQNFPTKSPICSRNDGISNRLDSITFPKWRNESIKAAGNAVVPQVVYEIFKAINATRK